MKRYIKPITKAITLSSQTIMISGSIKDGDTSTQFSNGRRNAWTSPWDED